jgi:hypothetical protein
MSAPAPTSSPANYLSARMLGSLGIAMTVIDARSSVGRLVEPSCEPPAARVSFRQPVSGSGFVDAGWWPRSRDLSVELPPLFDVLWTAGRDVNRVLYNLDFWLPAPRRLVVDGRSVRLGGFRRQDPLMLGFVDAWGRERIDILVVDPETERDVALRALAIASRADGGDRAERIMQLAQAGSRPGDEPESKPYRS